MSRKATLLRGLKITRVDLVDKGANFDPKTGEGAHVLLYKRDVSKGPYKDDSEDDDPEMTEALGKVAEMMRRKIGSAMKEAKTPGELNRKVMDCMGEMYKAAPEGREEGMTDVTKDPAKALEAAQAELAETKKNLESVTKERDDARAALEVAKKAPVDEFAALPEAVRKRITDSEATVAKLLDERETREFEKAAGAFSKLSSTPEKLGQILRAVKKGTTEDTFKALTELLAACNEQIAKGLLFGVVGKTGAGSAPWSAVAKIQARANVLKSEDAKLSDADAVSKALAENPELYAEYRTETQVKV